MMSTVPAETRGTDQRPTERQLEQAHHAMSFLGTMVGTCQPELAQHVLSWMMINHGHAREPDVIIRRPDGTPYLRRWWVIPRNESHNVYLHNMLGSDEDVLHDHMYDSVSLALSDGLVENYVEDAPFQREKDGRWKPGAFKERRVRKGDVIARSPLLAHQLVVESPAWTVFVTGPRLKPWGFWCPRGWMGWKEYGGVDSGIQGQDGANPARARGCGED